VTPDHLADRTVYGIDGVDYSRTRVKLKTTDSGGYSDIWLMYFNSRTKLKKGLSQAFGNQKTV
jgi:hypothetical protein